MARVRSANYAEIQRGILAKAAELFATKGYERTSIADLTEVCVQSRGALYHYFDSKDALLRDMLEVYVRGMLTRVEEASAIGGTAAERLRRIIEVAVDYNAESPNEQVILLNDLASLGEREQQPIIKMQRRIVDLLTEVILLLDHGGKVTRVNKKMHTMMLLGIINYAHTWYDPSKSVKPKQFADMVIALFLTGVTGASAARPPAAARARANPARHRRRFKA